MRSKIYHDLNESIYTATMKGFTFYFSSLLHLDKFNSQISEFIKDETPKLENKFKAKSIDAEIPLAIILYKKIESRGFRVVKPDGNDYELNYLMR